MFILQSASSTALRASLQGGDRAVAVLGVSDAAMYFRIADHHRDRSGDPSVLGVLTDDAVRLPCALVLPTSRTELDLRTIAPKVGAAGLIGGDRITWEAERGDTIEVRVAREWVPSRVTRVRPLATRVARFDVLTQRVAIGIPRDHASMLNTRHTPTGQAMAVEALLGRGPGLTPSGDDVLVGFLLGAHSLDLEIDQVREAVTCLAPRMTTSLSAQLLRHALDGDCIAEVPRLLDALAGNEPLVRAMNDLCRVGHTSGPAIAVGICEAVALAMREVPANGQSALSPAH